MEASYWGDDRQRWGEMKSRSLDAFDKKIFAFLSEYVILDLCWFSKLI